MVCTRKFPENLSAHLTTLGLADLIKRDAPEFSNTYVTELSLPVTFKSYP